MVRLGPINYKVENYRVNSNDCLCGQVDKEEVGSSNPCEYQKINCKEEGKSEVILGG